MSSKTEQKIDQNNSRVHILGHKSNVEKNQTKKVNVRKKQLEKKVPSEL